MKHPLRAAKEHLAMLERTGQHPETLLAQLVEHCEKEPPADAVRRLAADAVDMLWTQAGDRVHAHRVMFDVIKAARRLHE